MSGTNASEAPSFHGLADPQTDANEQSMKDDHNESSHGSNVVGIANNISNDIGLYIHWPYCRKRCPYCAFNTYVRATPPDESVWLDALTRHLRWWQQRTGSLKLDTIFLGGGTPSLMSPRLVEALIRVSTDLWPPSQRLEITMEVNPTSKPNFEAFRQAGVTRASVGVQSIRDDALKFLGRDHTAAEALQTYKLAQRSFASVNMDLIYARPGQTLADWQQELNEVFEVLDPAHVSPYQLTIEPDTPFEVAVRHRRWQPLDPDLEADLYDATLDRLHTAGLKRYEVSNFARAGHAARHNIRYWQSRTVLGIGPGAHGRWVRDLHTVEATTGLSNPDQWVNAVLSDQSPFKEQHVLPIDALFDEIVLMGLRWINGVSMARLRAIHPTRAETLRSRVADLINSGDLAFHSNHLRTTPQGMLRLNSVTLALLQ